MQGIKIKYEKKIQEVKMFYNFDSSSIHPYHP